MALLTLNKISISFGGPPLLDAVDFSLERGDRASLVGRNGEGKSTLLRLISGSLDADGGEIVVAQGVKIAYLPQQVPTDLHGTVAEIVEAASTDHSPAAHRVERVLSLVDLAGDLPFPTLSGGMKRRALLARALVNDPDVLLLDEPTNHLDIEAIEWLETFLKRFPGTILFVTHDRMFLRKLANRIIDLDRGRLAHWRCDYDTFLRRKQEQLDDEQVQNRRFDKKMAKEEIWIRKGIKARRTRDEGRVRALEKMRRERAERRSIVGTSRLQLQEAGPSGHLVVKAEDVTFGYGETTVIRGLTTTVMRGDKIGIIGPNGCGKTTLLRLLLGPYAASLDGDDGQDSGSRDHRTFKFERTRTRDGGLQPRSGSIRHGTRLEVAYFDQHRQELDGDASVFDNIAGGNDTVTINGQPRNVYGYLQDFLFDADRARTPVRILSGGERNRLLLAKLFTRPANLIVMDEPTNDLDAETLTLLEERLIDFEGTLLLVSHDREFLNNVVTSTLVFEGDGVVSEYVGGYDDWLRQRPPLSAPGAPAEADAPPSAAPASGPRRLNNKEKQELEQLPRKIETLERRQQELHDTLADPETYRKRGDGVADATRELEEIETALGRAYERWETLESVRAGASAAV